MVTVDRADCVLVLMDLQNDVVDPAGAFAVPHSEQPHVDRAVAVAAELLQWARVSDVPVVHVAVAYRSGHPETTDRVPLLEAVASSAALVEGSWGAGFHPAVAPADGEWTVTKRGISSFAGSDLGLLVARTGRRTTVLAGVSTNLVVLGTALAAADLGLFPVIVTDACAAASPQVHAAALEIAAAFSALVDAATATA